MSFREAAGMLKDGALSHPRPGQVVFIHLGDNGPKGTGSTYRDWREGMLSGLDARGLSSLMPDRDAVVGYEGLVLE